MSLSPVAVRERNLIVDVLRGAALFGILAANMRGFAAPGSVYFAHHLMWTGADRAVQALVDTVITGKFITIFAVLFGVGFIIQMDRASTGGAGFFLRRMAGLFLIGLAHAFGFWWGDILLVYAVCGLVLPLFRRLSAPALFRWGLTLYWAPVVAYAAFFVATLFGASPPGEATTPESIQKTIAIYANGSVAEIFVERAREWRQFNNPAFFIIGGTRIVALFLLGAWLWRSGRLREPEAHVAWWRRAQLIALPIGLVGNAAYAVIDLLYRPNMMVPSALTLTWVTIQSVAVPALSLFYTATVILLCQREEWRIRLAGFANVGRMALTNYLLQTVICTTIFYSYGLGLFGRVGPLLLLPLGVAIYAFQVPFSRWWLARQEYGPMEWAWRRLTYGSIRQHEAAQSSAS
jgi:uncharacterized protein